MDPLSITASSLAIVTAAIQSIRSLKEAVNRFKDRDKTLARLQHELEDLTDIMNALKEAIDKGISMVALLEGPVNRCNQVCREFENTMREFSGRSRLGLRDWTKMKLMSSVANRPTDPDRPLQSVGLGLSRLPVCWSRSVWLQRPGRSRSDSLI